MYDNIIIIMKTIRRERPALASPQNPIADVADNIIYYIIYVEIGVSTPYINTHYRYIYILYKRIIYIISVHHKKS